MTDTYSIDAYINRILAAYFVSENIHEQDRIVYSKLVFERLGLHASRPLTLRECAANVGRSYEWVRGVTQAISAWCSRYITSSQLSEFETLVTFIKSYTPIYRREMNFVLARSAYAGQDSSLSVDVVTVIASFLGVDPGLTVINNGSLLVKSEQEAFIVKKVINHAKSDVKRTGAARIATLAARVAKDTSFSQSEVSKIIHDLASSYDELAMVEANIVSITTGKSPVYLMARKLFGVKASFDVETVWRAWQTQVTQSPAGRRSSRSVLSKKGLINCILRYDEFILNNGRLHCTSRAQKTDALTQHEQMALRLTKKGDPAQGESFTLKEAVAAAEAAGLRGATMASMLKWMPFLVKRKDKRWEVIQDALPQGSILLPVGNKRSMFDTYTIKKAEVMLYFTYTEGPIVSVLPSELRQTLNDYPDCFRNAKGALHLSRSDGSNFLKGVSRIVRSSCPAAGEKMVITLLKEGTFALAFSDLHYAV